MERARFLAIGSAAALLPVKGRAQGLTKVRVAYSAVEELATPYFALQKGFFHDAGFDVEITSVRGSIAIAALGAGTYEFAIANTGALTSAHARGLPLVLLAPAALYSKAQPSAHIVVTKNSLARDGKDLLNKTMAVSSLRDMIQTATMCWIDGHGGNSASMKWFELSNTEMAAALTAGRVDCATTVEPFYTQSADLVKSIGLAYESVNGGKTFATTAIVGNQSWVLSNRDATRRFVQVLLKTADWANKNPNDVATLLAAASQTDAAALVAYHRVQFATNSDPQLIQPIIDAMAKYGFIQRRFPVAETTVA